MAKATGIAEMLAGLQAQLTALQSGGTVAAPKAPVQSKQIAYTKVEFVKGTFRKNEPSTALAFAAGEPGVNAVLTQAGSTYTRWIRADAFKAVVAILK